MTCVLLRPQNEPQVMHNLDKIENLIKTSENKYVFPQRTLLVWMMYLEIPIFILFNRQPMKPIFHLKGFPKTYTKSLFCLRLKN